MCHRIADSHSSLGPEAKPEQAVPAIHPSSSDVPNISCFWVDRMHKQPAAVEDSGILTRRGPVIFTPVAIPQLAVAGDQSGSMAKRKVRAWGPRDKSPIPICRNWKTTSADVVFVKACRRSVWWKSHPHTAPWIRLRAQIGRHKNR